MPAEYLIPEEYLSSLDSPFQQPYVLSRRLLDTSIGHIDPKETARVIKMLYDNNDSRGLIMVKDSCLVGMVLRDSPQLRPHALIDNALVYIIYSSETADMIEAKRDTLLIPRESGEIAQWCIKYLRPN